MVWPLFRLKQKKDLHTQPRILKKLAAEPGRGTDVQIQGVTGMMGTATNFSEGSQTLQSPKTYRVVQTFYTKKR